MIVHRKAELSQKRIPFEGPAVGKAHGCTFCTLTDKTVGNSSSVPMPHALCGGQLSRTRP